MQECYWNFLIVCQSDLMLNLLFNDRFYQSHSHLPHVNTYLLHHVSRILYNKYIRVDAYGEVVKKFWVLL